MSRRVLIGLGILLVLVGASAYGAQGRQRTFASAPPSGEILVTRAASEDKFAQLDVYALKSDGSHLRLVAHNADEAAVSRDGTQIAFVRNGAIWVMRRDGSQQRRVTVPQSRYPDDAPAWSADGTRLYFSRAYSLRAGDTASIFSVKTDGTGLRRLTRPSPYRDRHDDLALPFHEQPSVSPDGRFVVFTNCTTHCSIAEVTAGGAPKTPAFAFPDPGLGESEFVDPAWAPNGRRIAYGVWSLYPGYEEGPAGPFNTVFVSTAGGGFRRLAVWATSGPESQEVSSPSWSSDGRWLAFARTTGCDPLYARCCCFKWPSGNIWLVRPDGTALHKVTRTARYSAPAWLPPASSRSH